MIQQTSLMQETQQTSLEKTALRIRRLQTEHQANQIVEQKGHLMSEVNPATANQNPDLDKPLMQQDQKKPQLEKLGIGLDLMKLTDQSV